MRNITFTLDFLWETEQPGRESEQIIVELLKEISQKVQYVITNEAGASVYSASKLATEEFPNFDVGQRSAASIARRLQDPLAELVKIDPKIHWCGTVSARYEPEKAGRSPVRCVEDCVNKVGVDLNTASVSLLEYVSGISKAIAKNIVIYREENGQFTDRKELLKVAKLGRKPLNSVPVSCASGAEKILWTLPAYIRKATQRQKNSWKAWG